MSDEVGRQIAYGIGPEAASAQGTPVAPRFWTPHLEVDFYDKATKEMNESSAGSLAQYSGSAVFERYADGKIEGKIRDRSYGEFLLASFGSVTTSDNADSDASVKDHLFQMVESATPPSVTIARKDANSDKRFPLARLVNHEINVEVGEWAKHSSEFVSRKGVSASNTVAWTPENEFVPRHATVKLAEELGATMDAATAIKLKSLQLKIEKEVDRYHVFGTDDPDSIYVKQYRVNGEMVLRYSSQTYETAYFNDTQQALRVDLENTDVTIGAAAHPKIRYELPLLTFSEWDLDQPTDDIVEQTVGIEGLLSLADAYMIKAILTNTVASYAIPA